MSVVSTSQRLTLRCDGRTDQGPCANHLILDNNNEAMKEANEWLQRRGWRTLVDEYVQIHMCAYCAAKDSRFNTHKAARDVSKTGVAHAR